MEVLKDASSTAIYGSRGANGVIIVTTRRGTSGKPKVECKLLFRRFTGGWLSRREHRAAVQRRKREANRTSGTWNSVADDPKIFNAFELNAIQNNLWTNYVDELIHDGLQQDYQVGVSGRPQKRTQGISP